MEDKLHVERLEKEKEKEMEREGREADEKRSKCRDCGKRTRERGGREEPERQRVWRKREEKHGEMVRAREREREGGGFKERRTNRKEKYIGRKCRRRWEEETRPARALP